MNNSNGLVSVVLMLGLFIGFHSYKQLNKENRLLLIYLFVCLFFDLLNRVWGEFSNNNLFLFPYFSFAEMFFFFIYFRKIYERKTWWLSLICVASSGFMLYEAFILRNTAPINFQSYSKSLSAIVILLYTFDVLFGILKKSKLEIKEFKILGVLLIYFSLNAILFLPFNFLINAPTHIIVCFWIMYVLLTLVYYILIVAEIWKNGMMQK